ncbi:MAG: helix-turn-helix domain-containing protein [Magnetococcales bacterium]|nr:helix-turn-helix domain-containing protein [Magnetococcales bacterium]
MEKQSAVQKHIVPKLRQREAAAFLGLSCSTLEKWRCTGFGPAFHKLGRVVVYDQSELEAFVSVCRVASTSEYDARRTAGRQK